MGSIDVLIDFQSNRRSESGTVEGCRLGELLLAPVKFAVVKIVFEIDVILEFDLGFPVP